MLALVVAIAGCAYISGERVDTRFDVDGDGLDWPEDCDDRDAATGGPTDWYADRDGDGFGAGSGTAACTAPAGMVDNGDDCDDGSADARPDGTEACDGIDNDCDGRGDDEDADAVPEGASIWYRDADGDGYGDPDVAVQACTRPSGYLAPAEDMDCDEAFDDTHPGATEICNDGRDNGCDGASASCELSLEDAHVVLVGEEANDRAGEAITAAGDVNGDGFDDVLVGVSNHDAGASYSGAAYLVQGPVSGVVDLSLAEAKLAGAGASAGAGAGVAGPGDLDDDGLADLVVGASGQSVEGVRGGVVYVVLEASSGGPIDLADSDTILFGEGDDDQAGADVAAAGDLDGDGVPEFLVGASRADGWSGAVYVVSGAPGGTVGLAQVGVKLSGSGGEHAGSSVAGLGDVDGDGRDDIAVGATTDLYGEGNVGRAYLFQGPLSVDRAVEDAWSIISGTAAFDSVGCALSPAGDADGDGRRDVLVGSGVEAWEDERGGVTWLVSAPEEGVHLVSDVGIRLVGEEPSDLAGRSLGGGGDLDGDGQDDVLIGASHALGLAGAVYLLTGPIHGEVALSNAAVKMTGGKGDQAGEALSLAGDVNGDGLVDILAGAAGDDAGGGSAGAAYFVLGGIGP